MGRRHRGRSWVGHNNSWRCSRCRRRRRSSTRTRGITDTICGLASFVICFNAVVHHVCHFFLALPPHVVLEIEDGRPHPLQEPEPLLVTCRPQAVQYLLLHKHQVGTAIIQGREELLVLPCRPRNTAVLSSCGCCVAGGGADKGFGAGESCIASVSSVLRGVLHITTHWGCTMVDSCR